MDNLFKILDKYGVVRFFCSLLIAVVLILITPTFIIDFINDKKIVPEQYTAFILIGIYFLFFFLSYDVFNKKITNINKNNDFDKKQMWIINNIYNNFLPEVQSIIYEFFDDNTKHYISEVYIKDNKFTKSLEDLGVLFCDHTASMFHKIDIYDGNSQENYNKSLYILDDEYLEALNYYYKKTGKIIGDHKNKND